MKHRKILQDIWTTGEIKDTYGLDMSWPSNQQTSESKEKTLLSNQKNPNEKFLKLETQIQELKAKIEQLEKEKKLYWIISGLVLISLAGLIAWLTFKNHKSKKNNKD